MRGKEERDNWEGEKERIQERKGKINKTEKKEREKWKGKRRKKGERKC